MPHSLPKSFYLYGVRNRVKHIITLALVLLVSMHYIGIGLLHAVYEYDRQLFIELFCQNTDKPEMLCNGSCMLSKMNDEEPSDAASPVQLNVLQFQMHYHNGEAQKTDEMEFSETNHFFYYSDFYTSLFYSEIFRPPIMI